MGMSTDGILAFGVTLAEECELPWMAEEFGGDLESWWRTVNGFVDVYQPWTPEGNYAAGWSKDDPRFSEYFEARRTWEKANPCPVVDVNICHGDYPIWAIVVPRTLNRARRGSPVPIDPLALTVTEAHGYQVDEGYRFDTATHPQEQGMWNLAVIAYDFIQGMEIDQVLMELEE